jgi:bifunctional UDP-N-acetylglucosamine pyrophosphorylase/glucosamine-1-phosphate N-acetyltransferase
MKLSVIVLAAGLGTRMKSRMAKVLHRAGGVTLVEHAVRAARKLTPPERIVVVTGYQAGAVEAALRPYGVRFAHQAEPKGTGHAVQCCAELLAGEPGRVLLLYGDVPLLSVATLRALLDEHAGSGAAATLLSTHFEDPTGYGRVIRDAAGDVAAIVEQKAGTPEQLAVREINSGICCFEAGPLWKHLGELQPNNPARELYLTDMAAILRGHGHRVAAFLAPRSTELLGINTRVELARADGILRAAKNEELMLGGVTIENPATVSIDVDVTVGADTVIEPFVRLLGRTAVGEQCRIGAGAVVENSRLGDGVELLPYTLLADSEVDTGAHLGPFSRLRPGNRVGAGAKVGNFVELKNTRLGAGAKAPHLSYLGDSEIGAGVNVGAGTITCNYDGAAKHRTVIGEGAFIGSNSTLVAPVEIGAGAYVGAGSVITDAVPPGALALGRGRQVVKEGWAKKRKAGS